MCGHTAVETALLPLPWPLRWTVPPSCRWARSWRCATKAATFLWRAKCEHAEPVAVAVPLLARVCGHNGGLCRQRNAPCAVGSCGVMHASDLPLPFTRSLFVQHEQPHGPRPQICVSWVGSWQWAVDAWLPPTSRRCIAHAGCDVHPPALLSICSKNEALFISRIRGISGQASRVTECINQLLACHAMPCHAWHHASTARAASMPTILSEPHLVLLFADSCTGARCAMEREGSV